MHMLNRRERRKRDAAVRAVMRRLAPKALHHNQSGEKVFLANDVAKAIGLSPEEYAAALEITGFTNTVRRVDLRNYARLT